MMRRCCPPTLHPGPARTGDRVLFAAAAFLLIYTLWRRHDMLPTLDRMLQALWLFSSL